MIKDLIKDLIKECRRRRILKDIKKAKKCFEETDALFMCVAFQMINKKYRYNPTNSIIPEFNQDFLNAQYKQYRSVWWDSSDRESRIKAFDKLIETYSKK